MNNKKDLTQGRRKARGRKTKLVVRQLTTQDFNAYSELRRAATRAGEAVPKKLFESLVAAFPQGQIGVEYKGELIATCLSISIDTDLHGEKLLLTPSPLTTLLQYHDPKAETLVCPIPLVHRDFAEMNPSLRLYETLRRYASDNNLMRIVVPAAATHYSRHRQKLSVREYVDSVLFGPRRDAAIETLPAHGFALKRTGAAQTIKKEAATPILLFEWLNVDHTVGSHKHYVPSRPLRICSVQYQMRSVSGFSEFAEQCDYFADVASDYHCDFVLFPELLTTQLLSCIESKEPHTAARELTSYTTKYIDLFTSLALRGNINIIAGTHFVLEDEKLYNVAFLFKRDGSHERQYKIHITPSERQWWGVQPGSEIRAFDTDRGKIGIQICYDVEFPEMTRILAAQGAEVIFVPFCTDERHGYLRVRHCTIARCIENHVYAAAAGTVGNLPEVECFDIQYAQSGIFTPSDFGFARDCVAAECTPNIETLVIHDIDLEVARRHRIKGTTLNWNDRRTDLYEVRLKLDGQGAGGSGAAVSAEEMMKR